MAIKQLEVKYHGLGEAVDAISALAANLPQRLADADKAGNVAQAFTNVEQWWPDVPPVPGCECLCMYLRRKWQTKEAKALRTIFEGHRVACHLVSDAGEAPQHKL